MAKLPSSSVIVLFAALLLVGHAAAAFRTIITTVDTTTSNDSESCRREMQQRDMNPCMMFLKEQMSRYGGRDEDKSRNFDMCCQELRQMRDERCRCEALEMEMKQQQGQMRSQQQMQEMMRTAERLPSMCRVGPSRCQFETEYY